jgi:hypothetical protein
MTSNRNDEMIPATAAREAVRAMTRRTALLHMCYARTLVQELGEERGRELIRQAIWEYGTKVGEQTRERVEGLGLEPTPENFRQGSDLPSIGFDSQRVTVEGEERNQVFGCVLAEVWQKYGEEELGGLYCLVDPAKMQAYDPDWTMVHTKRVPAGEEICEIVVRRL